MASGPHCPAGLAWWTSVSGPLPPFSCERQARRHRGLGTTICSGSSLCRDPGPTAGVEGEGWGGSWQKAPSGRGRLCRAGLLRHHLCPALPDGLGSAPSGAPSPAWATPMRGHPALPRGGCGARVCPPGHPASVTGWPALGTVPGNHLWVTRRLSSHGTSSSTDLAWTAGRSSRAARVSPGRGRKGQEGTASLCRRTVAHVPRKGGLRPLLAGTLGTRVGSTLASDASGSGCPPSLSGSDSADTEQCFSLFQLELLEPLALGGCGCGERCLRGAEPPGDPRGLPGDR